MSSQRGKWAGGVPPKWLRHCRQSPFASSSTSAAIVSSSAGISQIAAGEADLRPRRAVVGA